MRKGLVFAVMLTFVVLAPGHLAAQEATSAAGEFVTPDPAECTVEPRSLESLLAISATPGLGTPPVSPPSMAHATPGIQLPESEPADQATVEAVTATIHELVACVNAGAPLRQFALYTDNVLRTFEAEEPLTAEERIARFGGTPEARPSERFLSVRVAEVRVLPDGDVIAVTEDRSRRGSGTLVYLLVKRGDRYLIDGVVDDAFDPAGAPGAGTPPA